MSKSRGRFINATTYLKHLNPEYLRYYFAAKLNGTIDDIDINLEDFVARVNSDLVGKIVNIASRCAGFSTRQFDGELAPALDDRQQWQRFREAVDAVFARRDSERQSQQAHFDEWMAARRRQLETLETLLNARPTGRRTSNPP